MAEEKDTIKIATALYSAIVQLDSIKEEYKEFAKKYKDKPETLQEILLCAADEVDIALMQLAVQKVPQNTSLAKCRRKHWEKLLFRNYHEELESIIHTVNSIESGMRAVSTQISVIEDKVPTMEELFQKRTPAEPKEAVDMPKEMLQPEKITAAIPEQKESVPNFGTDSLITDMSILFATRSKKRKEAKELQRKLRQDKKEPLSKWFSNLEKQGYNAEQLQFILSCIDEGMERQEIEHFIAPNLSVDIMENLKKLELKKRGKSND